MKIEIERELEPSLTVKPELKTKIAAEKDLIQFLGKVCGNFGVNWSKAVYLKQDNGQQMR